MALLNYSTPYHHSASNPLSYVPHQLPSFATLPPPIPFQHQPVQTHGQQSDIRTPYHYPRPQNPFTREDQQHAHVHHQHHQLNQQVESDDPPPATPHYTRVNVASANSANTKTRVHAVIDYDGDYYDGDDDDAGGGGEGSLVRPPQQSVTPIQGPIFLKNGSVPVVPLYSYPQVNNGSFVQIPILWTALSVALGLELKGEYIRGVPCIKRHQQLFCPTAGNTYPIDRIELFIDENKALMKRMYGEFIMGPEYGPEPSTKSARKQKRATGATGTGSDPGGGGRRKPGVPDLHGEPEAESIFGNLRGTRQSFKNNQSSESGRVDACESKIEIVTPYWASNSAGKIRAIVNTQHFEQAIHQEVCAKSRTNRCSGDCGCEQKYKWHRLLAYDPDNDCKGIFMDWFLFPSCCVCRCNPT